MAAVQTGGQTGTCGFQPKDVKIVHTLQPHIPASPFPSEPGVFLNKKLPVIVNTEGTPNLLVNVAGHL